MALHPIDMAIIIAFLILNALIGVYVQKKATANIDAYFLADRNVPWWMLGLSGCSSYIDIGGTMALVGAVFYLGAKSVWMTHIFWGLLIISFYMAFQAKYIRRSGVMTFAQWNLTRFGDTRDTEQARIASASFVLILMVFNMMLLAVGTGKFAEEFLPFSRWQSSLIVFAVVGFYVTLGGFKGVIATDVFQTILIAIGALVLAAMALQSSVDPALLAGKDPEWSSLAPTWKLWPSYLTDTPAAYAHYDAFGTMLLAGSGWLIFRVLAGPNVWDFQFFLSVKSPRDGSLAAGLWTVGFTLRWTIVCSFLILGMAYLDTSAGLDAEKIMPLVLKNLPIGLQGIFMAVLLAALMSSLSAMISVTSSVFTNDFLARYWVKNFSGKQLVHAGQLVSVGAITLGFIFSLAFNDIVSAWETTIFVVVTMILVPSTCRWHWWRFSAKAFVWSMIATAVFIVFQKLAFPAWGVVLSLGVNTLASFVLTVAIGAAMKPAAMDTLVSFYAKVRPFGFWGPVRREAEIRGLVPKNDKMPLIDVLNGGLAAVFQVSLAIIPYYMFLRRWDMMWLWVGIALALAAVMYFTWYKNLPSPDEA